MSAKNKPVYVYGPVPSRRLGYSLGIDVIPFKTCTLDCVYCQLGPTTHKTIRRKNPYPPNQILSQIRKAIQSGQQIDYITFSGSGEPSLNFSIGELIREIKKFTRIPVAVLTNTTLLYRKEVRKALKSADLVVPSLDAATQRLFSQINRPHPHITADKCIQGLKTFRGNFQGSIWLEVMLIKGINDSPPHIQKLKQVISEIQPEKVQLNTVIRPPAEEYARPLTPEKIEEIKNELGAHCEIIAEFHKKGQTQPSQDLEEAILSLVRRRPVTLSDISASLGKHQNEILKYLNFLLEDGKIKYVPHQDSVYYEPN
ncbi:radical SAM protein [bacterium]|nr:radical SAM protein [bacterium]